MIKLPGLYSEQLPSGKTRYLVRPEGNRRKRITIRGEPLSSQWFEEYAAARNGEDPRADRALVNEVRRRCEGDIKKMLARCRARAEERGFEYDLNEAWFWDAMWRQKGRCAVSKMPFDASPGEGARRPFSPSIDRVDVSVGYTKDNCRITTLIVNTARSDFGDDALIKMCKAILRSF